MKKKIRTLLTIGIIAIVAAGAYGIYYYNQVSDYRKAVEAIEIREPDLSKLDDGKYTGSHDVGFIRAKVAVEVKDHRILSVKMLKHENGRGSSAEILPSNMVEEQKVDVDAVSGATNSSKVIKKAVEKALVEANDHN